MGGGAFAVNVNSSRPLSLLWGGRFRLSYYACEPAGTWNWCGSTETVSQKSLLQEQTKQLLHTGIQRRKNVPYVPLRLLYAANQYGALLLNLLG